ncbi:hypothetical protein LX36DRAFT_200053 [Colletotrichum falcatum]|nr:hypothetical protein LX36DRAFT_200053 [Colletotrichum falcatum]
MCICKDRRTRFEQEKDEKRGMINTITQGGEGVAGGRIRKGKKKNPQNSLQCRGIGNNMGEEVPAGFTAPGNSLLQHPEKGSLDDKKKDKKKRGTDTQRGNLVGRVCLCACVLARRRCAGWFSTVTQSLPQPRVVMAKGGRERRKQVLPPNAVGRRGRKLIPHGVLET